MSQRELAQARRQLEEQAERAAAHEVAQRRLRQLATRLDQRLTRSESVSGVRGWLKRRQLSTMPRTEEDDALAVLRSSSLMKGAWYLTRYPEVVSTGLSPALHYLRVGAAQHKDPGPAFNTRKYLAQHPDLPRDVNPLVHFHAANPGPAA
ncbi:hypothetical protein [Aeromicrobium yanjiei]|nr:hypothetical protein [Aeromicrobium yanjiei]